MKKTPTRRSVISLTLCFALCAAMLSACSGGGASSSAAPQSGSSAAPAASSEAAQATLSYNGSSPVFEETKTISVLSSNGASRNNEFAGMDWFQEILRRANVQLDIELVDPSSYEDAVKPRLAAAVDLPDLIALPGNDSDMAYINSGIFIDLTDYFDKYGFNLNPRMEEDAYAGIRGEITTPDGKMYYIPAMNLTVDWCRSLMLNFRWLDELNLSAPTTLDEYYEYLKAVKTTDLNHNGENDEIPLFMRAGMTQLFGNFWDLDLLVGYRQDDAGKVTCSYIEPAYRDCLAWLNKLYSEGLLYSEFATANLDTQTALFHNDQIGSIFHFLSNCTGYSQQIDPSWDFNSDTPIMQPIIPPQGPNGQTYFYGRDPLGTFFGITRDCEDPEAVFCFADYLYSEEAAELAWYGLEGTDYNIENGEIVFTDVFLNNEDNYRTRMGYNCSALPNIQIPGSYGATQCKAIMEANEINRTHARNPIGFTFHLPEEIETIQAYSADLKTYFDEMFVAFVTGTTPLTEWDSYVNNVKAMHVDEVTAIYQAVCDRQNAAG
ncbi:MAG: extracellular solute-binding protein [Provencibacterium sp.]|nr:extracellular solute-binding protein [Provencibacterium sp.]